MSDVELPTGKNPCRQFVYRMYVKRKEIFKNVRRTVSCNQDIVRRINVFGRPYYYVKRNSDRGFPLSQCHISAYGKK